VRRKNGLFDEKREEARERERERVKKRRIPRRWEERQYYTCALGPSAFAFENEMRKHGPSLGLSRARAADKDGDGEGQAGKGNGRYTPLVSSEKGRRSFDPSLTGPLLASFSLVTRIPRPSDQIIVLGVDSGSHMETTRRHLHSRERERERENTREQEEREKQTGGETELSFSLSACHSFRITQ